MNLTFQKKSILYGAVFQCLDPILTIAACLSEKSPFLTPMDKRDEAMEFNFLSFFLPFH
mgnify:CR=1 FL=1